LRIDLGIHSLGIDDRGQARRRPATRGNEMGGVVSVITGSQSSMSRSPINIQSSMTRSQILNVVIYFSLA
jgi:hypothetical protein